MVWWYYVNFYTQIVYFLHPYEGRYWSMAHLLAWTNTNHTSHNNQIGVGVRFLCGDDGREAFIWGIMPDFYYFGASKMGWFFTYFGIDGTILNAWDKTTINKPFSGVYRWGLWCYFGCGGWIGPTWEHFLSLSWYLTYPPQNNHFGSKWYHAAHQWQNALTQQSTGIGRTVFIGGWWSLTNVAAYNIRFGCNFLYTKSAAMDGDGCGETWRSKQQYTKRTHIMDMIYEKGLIVLIAMIWQCLDSTIHMSVEKMRYPEIHQNKINQFNYTFSDPYRTNPIQHVTIN